MDELLNEALKHYKELQQLEPDNLSLPRFYGAMQKLIEREESKSQVAPKIVEENVYTIEQQLAMALGTIELQRQTLKEVAKIINEAPELNMGNYSEGQVEELNNKMIEAFGVLSKNNFITN